MYFYSQKRTFFMFWREIKECVWREVEGAGEYIRWQGRSVEKKHLGISPIKQNTIFYTKIKIEVEYNMHCIQHGEFVCILTMGFKYGMGLI